MVTYTGRGGIAGALFLLQLMAFGLMDGLQGAQAPLANPSWAWVAASLASAALCWLVGTRVNRGLARRFIDHVRVNGRDYAEGHTFFFVRLEYSGALTIPFALVVPYLVRMGL